MTRARAPRGPPRRCPSRRLGPRGEGAWPDLRRGPRDRGGDTTTEGGSRTRLAGPRVEEEEGERHGEGGEAARRDRLPRLATDRRAFATAAVGVRGACAPLCVKNAKQPHSLSPCVKILKQPLRETRRPGRGGRRSLPTGRACLCCSLRRDCRVCWRLRASSLATPPPASSSTWSGVAVDAAAPLAAARRLGRDGHGSGPARRGGSPTGSDFVGGLRGWVAGVGW